MSIGPAGHLLLLSAGPIKNLIKKLGTFPGYRIAAVPVQRSLSHPFQYAILVLEVLLKLRVVSVRELVRRQIRDAVHHSTTTTIISYLPYVLLVSLGRFKDLIH